MLRVQALCDWCGVTEFATSRDNYRAFDEWVGMTTGEPIDPDYPDYWMPLSERMLLNPAEALQCINLCPDCQPHVEWDEREQALAEVDRIGEALYESRDGQFYGEDLPEPATGRPNASMSPVKTVIPRGGMCEHRNWLAVAYHGSDPDKLRPYTHWCVRQPVVKTGSGRACWDDWWQCLGWALTPFDSLLT